MTNHSDTEASMTSTNTNNTSNTSMSSLNSTHAESHAHNLRIHLLSRNLTALPFEFSASPQDDLLRELNSLDLGGLSKKEKRNLKSRNSKYQLRWNLDNDFVKPQHFGQQWNGEFRAYVKGELERLSYMAKAAKHQS